MNSKILIIYEYQILFEILNEIKESLNFKIIQSNKNDYNKIEFDPKINYLTISKEKVENIDNNFLKYLMFRRSKIIKKLKIAPALLKLYEIFQYKMN